MVVRVVSFAEHKPKYRNWTNDELAELYRVEHALVQAGIALETISGISDEGDPWFAFCRSQGEVLVHITRYDGLYRLYSPALREPLVGSTFSDLTRSFVSGFRTPVQQSGTVSIHPAALLSVIVAAIFYTFDFHSNPAHAKAAADVGHDGKSPDLLLEPPTNDALNHTLVGNFAAFCSRGASEAVSFILTKVESAAILIASTIVALADQGLDLAAFTVGDGPGATLAGGHQDQQSPPDASSTRDQDHASAHSEVSFTTSGDPAGLALDNVQVSGTLITVTKTDASSEKTTSSSPEADQLQFTNFADNTDSPKAGPNGSALTALADSIALTAEPEGLHGKATSHDSSIGTIGAQDTGSPDGSPHSTVNVTLTNGATASLSGVAPNLETVNVNLTDGGGNIDLTGATGINTITLAGDGSLQISGAVAGGSLEVAIDSHYDVSLAFGVGFTDLAPVIKLLGQDQLSLTNVPKTSLTLDSEGSDVNKVTIADTAVSAGETLDLTIAGIQDLLLQESAAAFDNTQFHTSTYAGSLTIGVDLQNAPQSIDLSKVDATSYIVGDAGNVASVDAANGAHIELGSGLNIVDVSVDGATASAPGSLSFDIGGGSGPPTPGFVNLLQPSLASDVVLNSSGVGAGVNMIVTLSDSALASLTLTGDFALTIGNLTGPTAADNQDVTIDAHALTGALNLNVSNVADTVAGGRSITIVGGADSNVLTNLTATESTTFILGPGENTINIGAASLSDTIVGLTASTAVNVGAGGYADSIIDQSNAATSQGLINNQTSLVGAAQIAAGITDSSVAHQALLFTYQGVEYAFIDANGNHVFDPAHDAIIKLIGISTTANLTGVFHSA